MWWIGFVGKSKLIQHGYTIKVHQTVTRYTYDLTKISFKKNHTQNMKNGSRQCACQCTSYKMFLCGFNHSTVNIINFILEILNNCRMSLMLLHHTVLYYTQVTSIYTGIKSKANIFI